MKHKSYLKYNEKSKFSNLGKNRTFCSCFPAALFRPVAYYISLISLHLHYQFIVDLFLGFAFWAL